MQSCLLNDTTSKIRNLILHMDFRPPPFYPETQCNKEIGRGPQHGLDMAPVVIIINNENAYFYFKCIYISLIK